MVLLQMPMVVKGVEWKKAGLAVQKGGELRLPEAESGRQKVKVKCEDRLKSVKWRRQV